MRARCTICRARYERTGSHKTCSPECSAQLRVVYKERASTKRKQLKYQREYASRPGFAEKRKKWKADYKARQKAKEIEAPTSAPATNPIPYHKRPEVKARARERRKLRMTSLENRRKQAMHQKAYLEKPGVRARIAAKAKLYRQSDGYKARQALKRADPQYMYVQKLKRVHRNLKSITVHVNPNVQDMRF